ncbi:MAG: TIGR04282 family arsenosugar biosynthesis glycosyltransferase [Desulfobulbaceae bacterium]|nr:TIGR04282 family arsenosugar biosynthesis glycosyltransferase [Desulfobulbaceae bacterium]
MAKNQKLSIANDHRLSPVFKRLQGASAADKADRVPCNRLLLILFTRYPEPGNTKTRLIPALGADGAADLQRQLTEHAVLKVKEVCCTQPDLALEIHFQGGDAAAMTSWLGAHNFRQQTAGTIGQRMERAFAHAFSSGRTAVVLIGTDCPGLNTDILHEAFDALHKNDLVIGPAVDGGYYLIGLKAPHPFLFDDISWGSASVLQQTLAKANSLTVSLLPPLHDIDRPDDLAHFDYHPNP